MSRHYQSPQPRNRNAIRPEISRRALARQERYQASRSIKTQRDSTQPPAMYLDIPGIIERPEFYSDFTGALDVKTGGKVGAVVTVAALVLYAIAGGSFPKIGNDGHKDQPKNPNDGGSFHYPSSGSTHINWDVSNGDDMRELSAVDENTPEGKLILHFLHKEGNKGDAIEHKAILDRSSGDYRQSEEWADSSKGDPVKWEKVPYEGVPWLFEHPTKEGTPKEWLNAIEGDLSMINGTPTIINITKIALYDGQVSKLGQQDNFKGIVQSVEDKPSGAKLVHLIVPSAGTSYKKLVYLSGNRLYEAGNGMQTVNQLNTKPGDVITVSGKIVDEWGQLMPKNEQVDGALYVFDYKLDR